MPNLYVAFILFNIKLWTFLIKMYFILWISVIALIWIRNRDSGILIETENIIDGDSMQIIHDDLIRQKKAYNHRNIIKIDNIKSLKNW